MPQILISNSLRPKPLGRSVPTSRYAADAFAYKLMTDRRDKRPRVSLRLQSQCGGGVIKGRGWVMTIRLIYPSILDVKSKNGVEVKFDIISEIAYQNLWSKLYLYMYSKYNV
jgi:hypothetical protein